MKKDWTGNSASIYKTIGASNHTENERQADDYYATNPIAIDKLLKVEKPYKYIWECAYGEKHLANRLKSYGYKVKCTDLRNRRENETQDFLKCNKSVVAYAWFVWEKGYKGKTIIDWI